MAIDAGSAFISIDGVEVSSQCLSIAALDQSREEVDITTFGASIRNLQATLEQANEIQVVFNVDDWGDALHTKLNLMWANPQTGYAIKIRPTSAAISATNPEFQFNARLIRYPRFDQAAPGQTFKQTCVIRRIDAVVLDILP